MEIKDYEFKAMADTIELYSKKVFVYGEPRKLTEEQREKILSEITETELADCFYEGFQSLMAFKYKELFGGL